MKLLALNWMTRVQFFNTTSSQEFVPVQPSFQWVQDDKMSGVCSFSPPSISES
jgi:hypothetical protein